MDTSIIIAAVALIAMIILIITAVSYSANPNEQTDSQMIASEENLEENPERRQERRDRVHL